MKAEQFTFPIFYKTTGDGSRGRMFGSIPWRLLQAEGESLLLISQQGPINYDSIRISASKHTRQNFGIDLTLVDDRSVLAVRRDPVDKRQSKYYAVNLLEVGETILCEWNWNGKTTPREHAVIYRIYMRQVKRGRRLVWKSSPEGVYLTRAK